MALAVALASLAVGKGQVCERVLFAIRVMGPLICRAGCAEIATYLWSPNLSIKGQLPVVRKQRQSHRSSHSIVWQSHRHIASYY